MNNLYTFLLVMETIMDMLKKDGKTLEVYVAMQVVRLIQGPHIVNSSWMKYANGAR
ncbi:hypothetical protein IC582_010738 [Cucumis melo]